jgi:ABC transport system ATP-binding/permease protein
MGRGVSTMTILLSSQGLSKSYGPRPLFTDVSLDLRVGERVGLIGPNGSGKSTLLKILAGLETPDSGVLSVRRTARLCYLAQEAAFDPMQTVEEVLTDALKDDPAEEHERATQVGVILGKTGFLSADEKVGVLSGGWRKRLAVARELVRRPDLLLLDEPTNHLDLEGILWLEELLQDAPFAYVVVSHDRYFLENVTNQIVELDRIYPDGYFRAAGPYSDFLTLREEFLVGQARQEESLAGKVRREAEWLQRGAQARTGKSASRIREAGRLIGDLKAIKARNAPTNTVEIDFAATGRKSTKLVAVEGLTKALGGRPLFAGLSFALTPGDKLGLLGPNGSGKTTLLRVLAGEAVPDGGTLKRADGLRVVAFDQDRGRLDRTAPLRRALAPNADVVVYQGRSFHVTSWAKRFLFRNEQLDLPVGDLSGGEQARILIARLMLQPADVLLLDEPTNDLDIASLEVLEEGLLDFPGALVLVTHDRSLLDRVCTNVLGLDGQGGSKVFADYSQWSAAQRNLGAAKVKQAASSAKAARAPREKSRRLTYKEQREWEEMEGRILAAEEAAAVRQKEVETAGSGADHVRLQECCKALETAQAEVERLYGRWQELEAKQAQG